MQGFPWSNLFIHIDLGHDVFELSIAEHADVNVLHSENLSTREQRDGH
jgi:hypothetical protein